MLKVIKWSGKAKRCDICGIKLKKVQYFVDGAQQMIGCCDSQWALMCPLCHILHGTGLGIGIGQAYDSKSKKMIAGGIK